MTDVETAVNRWCGSMLILRDVKRFFAKRYEIVQMNRDIVRCHDCETDTYVSLCETHREELYE